MKLVPLLLVAALSFGSTGYAQNKPNESETTQEKCDRKETMKDLKDKFESLTDKQKDELLAIHDKMCTAKENLISKYVEFGLLSEAQGQAIEQHHNEHAKKVKETKDFLGLSIGKTPKENGKANGQHNDKHKKQAEEMKDMQSKFEALSDKQKDELYAIYDEIKELNLSLIDKFVEFELMSADAGEKMSTYLDEYSKEVREGKKFIGIPLLKSVSTDEQTDDSSEEKSEQSE